jgi:peroxidase
MSIIATNVEKVVATKFAFDPTNAKIQLHLFFHDCFMQRCDASILINSTNSTNMNQVEKNVTINFSLGNFFVIDDIREQLEKKCPSVVSCINVLALVAIYFIK